MTRLDARAVAANRAAVKWSRREQAARVLWACARPLFALSPRPLWGWRRFLLRAFGARVGVQVHVCPGVRVFMPWNVELGDYAAVGDGAILYALGPVRIGAGASVSQGAHLCAGTHDHRDPLMPLVKARIDIGAGAWICAEAFIGPDVRVGERAVVAARAVAVRDVADGCVAAGSPARIVGTR
jgi:putative colanic acid biosynthesis acetyltransferase WcaF